MSISSDTEIIRAYYPHCAWPKLYYGVVTELAASIKARNILEVGVAFGYHAENILNSLSTVTYYGIDPYKAGYDKKDSHVASVCQLFSEPDGQQAVNRLYDVVRVKLSAYGTRAKLSRESSTYAAKRFLAGFFDLIFIDGNHTYDAVKSDLSAWWPKLKTGGIFCGDDYLWAGVKTAVDEFASANNQAVKFVAKKGTNYPIWFINKSS
jgi:predicted O-methyltransferase YrrM